MNDAEIREINAHWSAYRRSYLMAAAFGGTLIAGTVVLLALAGGAGALGLLAFIVLGLLVVGGQLFHALWMLLTRTRLASPPVPWRIGVRGGVLTLEIEGLQHEADVGSVEAVVANQDVEEEEVPGTEVPILIRFVGCTDCLVLGSGAHGLRDFLDWAKEQGVLE